MIDSKEEELYRIMLHIGSISETNAGNFSEARSKHTKDTKSPAKQTEDSPDEQTYSQMLKSGNGDLHHLITQKWGNIRITKKPSNSSPT